MYRLKKINQKTWRQENGKAKNDMIRGNEKDLNEVGVRNWKESGSKKIVDKSERPQSQRPLYPVALFGTY